MLQCACIRKGLYDFYYTCTLDNEWDMKIIIYFLYLTSVSLAWSR